LRVSRVLPSAQAAPVPFAIGDGNGARPTASPPSPKAGSDAGPMEGHGKNAGETRRRNTQAHVYDSAHGWQSRTTRREGEANENERWKDTGGNVEREFSFSGVKPVFENVDS